MKYTIDKEEYNQCLVNIMLFTFCVCPGLTCDTCDKTQKKLSLNKNRKNENYYFYYFCQKFKITIKILIETQ